MGELRRPIIRNRDLKIFWKLLEDAQIFSLVIYSTLVTEFIPNANDVFFL